MSDLDEHGNLHRLLGGYLLGGLDEADTDRLDEHLHDCADCRATAEMWEKHKRTDADSLYDAACMRAVTAAVLRASDRSESTAEADRAMAWLR